ncbi:MAG: flagellar basal-body MS-ring/collar protein FliF [Pseudomonadota bacterium]
MANTLRQLRASEHVGDQTVMMAFLQNLGAARLAAMGVVALLLVGFFAFITMRVTAPTMAPLFTDLTFEDSSEVINQLEASGMVFDLRNNGTTILVPQEDVLRLRMSMAEQGLPTGGTVGYEIFDQSSTLGATSFVQSLNQLRALEGELGRTIQSINRVAAARVHLVLPERELFERNQREATASIVLRVRGTLSAGQIRAIQHLTASAVDGLAADRVSIVDETGELLASGAGDDMETMMASSLDERAIAIENRLRTQVEDILSEVVGPGRARVTVAVELNHNRVSETSEVFDPDGQVVRSTQLREETGSTNDTTAGEVTVGNELPGGEGDAPGGGIQEARETLEEVTNFEISTTNRTEILEAGGLDRLSVAVLVDGIYAQDGEGTQVYTPRTEEDLEQLAMLVRSAVGFDQGRGDVVEVVNLQFATRPDLTIPENEGLFAVTRDDIYRVAELALIAVLTLIILFFVVRPLLQRVLEPDEAPLAAEPAGGPAAENVVIGPNGEMVESPVPNVPAIAFESTTVKAFENAQVLGALQKQSLERVGKLIDEQPEEAVSVVRRWLSEPATG